MENKELPLHLREEYVSEETKALISTLTTDKGVLGKLCNYEGCWYYPNTLQGIRNFQSGFKPQDTDIVLASFPKAGTTWLKALTIAIIERSKTSSSLESDNPHVIVPFLEVGLDTERSPRIFSTHMPLHTLHKGLKESPCKIVYVTRNVKDVLVSLWHFHNRNKEVGFSSQRENINGVETCSLDDMFKTFCSGVVFYGPFWENVLSYWKGSLENPEHVLFLRYEELKAEPHQNLKKLAEFLGFPFTKEEEENGGIDRILNLCSIGYLSSLEINKTGKMWSGIGYNTFFRKGEVGDFKNHLTPEMESQLDSIIEEKFRGSGLKF